MAQQTLFTVNGLAVEFNRDRRAIAKYLRGTPPDGKTATGRPGWTLQTMLKVLEGRPDPSREKALLYRVQAELLELQLDRKRAQLLKTEEVVAAWANVRRLFETETYAVPGRVAERIAKLNTPGEIQKVIHAEICECLRRISETDPTTIGSGAIG